MNASTSHRRRAALLALALSVAVPMPAGAQWLSQTPAPPPLFPYTVTPERTAAAADSHSVRRPGARRRAVSHNANVSSGARRRSKVDPALIEELRRRPKVRRPVVIEDNQPGETSPRAVVDGSETQIKSAKGSRVIRAEAEITILGSDRMSIRLFKPRGSKSDGATD